MRQISRMWRLVVAGCLLAILSSGVAMVRAEDAMPKKKTATTINAAPSERVLLLHNGKVVKGVIRQSSTGYIVNAPGGHLVLAFDQVRLEAEDLEDAYRQQRDTLPDQTAAAHIELARWCLTNSLPDPARKELREALKREPDSTIAKNMLQRINDQLLAIKELPAVVQRNGQFSLIGDAKPGVPSETLGGLPREAASDFVSKVQPLLVNRCATAGCHGPGSENSFELQRAKVGKGAPKSYSERNLAAVLERIDRDRPLSSPLLTKLRGEPKSFGVRQSHGGLSSEQMQTLRAWIEAISNKSQKAVKPTDADTTDSESSDAAPRAKADSRKDRTDEKSDGDADADENLFRKLRRELRTESPKPDELNRSTSDE